MSGLTKTEFAKIKLYTDNILLNSRSPLRIWAFRIATHIEDMRLQFLEREQTASLVTQRELEEVTLDSDAEIRPG